MIRSVMIHQKSWTGLFTIPSRFIQMLGWVNRDKIYIMVFEDDKIELTKNLPSSNKNILSIFETKLNKVKQKTSYSYRLSLKKDIMNMMKFDVDNRTIDLDVDDDKLVITKV